MARLPRWVLPGGLHYVLLKAQAGRPAFADETDVAQGLVALREAALLHKVAVHGFAMNTQELQLLLSPPETAALSLCMQAFGRRYVAAYNRRHGCSGPLWDGRFRCAVVQPGEWALDALLLVASQPGHTHAAHHSGGARVGLLTDPPDYWALGNTPFDREARFRDRLEAGVAASRAQRLRQGAWGGWAVGEPAFVAALQADADRPVKPRAKGRPAKPAPK